jgi:hypothetical protein
VRRAGRPQAFSPCSLPFSPLKGTPIAAAPDAGSGHLRRPRSPCSPLLWAVRAARVADAVALNARGGIDTILDWKSDIAPSQSTGRTGMQERLPLYGYWTLTAHELWKMGYRRCIP